MDGGEDDEFGFSDPDLDDLPAKTLQHLEATAIRATQPLPTAPESDYGIDAGDEVVNLDDSEAMPLERAQITPFLFADDHIPQEMRQDNAHMPSQGPLPSQVNSDELLKRIKQLEQDKAREQRDAHALKLELQTKSGEADTLRRRNDADARLHERRLADQERVYATELGRLRAEMDQLRRDRDMAQTESMFNQYDARELNMARRTVASKTKTMASRPKSIAVAPGSPGAPQVPLGNGFDDADEFIMASPSKLRDKPKPTTPKHVGKRKRLVTDQSPIPLQLSGPRSQPQDVMLERTPEKTLLDLSLLDNFRQDDSRFVFLHRLLAQPTSNGNDRILEALTHYAFPSEPITKLSSILYDALATATAPHKHGLALHLANTFLDLWKRCHNERYYAPAPLILDTLHFILACEPVETAVQLSERAVPLIIAFVDLVSDPISKAAKGGSNAVAALYSHAQREISSHIQVVDCLNLLYLIAISCVSCSDPEAIVRFWQAIPSTFACMLLVKEQPCEQIAIMLRILSTSALEQTLGPITKMDSTLDAQSSSEDAMLHRLTNLFTETPRVIPDPSVSTSTPAEVSDAEVWDLRLLVLSVLTQFSITSYGSSRLAQNRLCIGRLVKYLDYCITSLYRQPLSPTQDSRVESINATMKLIYRITANKADFDIKSKLVNTLGGQHAYLVAFTRLAFSEGLLLEYGIEDEVVNMAHDILDEGLSMEEGDAFGNVYSNGSTT